MTFGEARDRTAYLIGDKYLANSEHLFIDDTINEAYDFVTHSTYWHWAIVTMNSTAEVRDYSLIIKELDANGNEYERDIYKILSVTYMTTAPNTYQILKVKSHYGMDTNHQTWLSQSSSTPTKAVIDNTVLSLDPMPDESRADAIRILMFLDYPKLVNTTDKILLPKRYARYVPIYCFNALKNNYGDNIKLGMLLEKERGKNITWASQEFIRRIGGTGSESLSAFES